MRRTRRKTAAPAAPPAPPAGRASARLLDAAAVACGVFVSGAIYAPRLPVTSDLLLPRRFGFFLFEGAIAAWTRPWAAALLSTGVLVSAALCVAALAWDVFSSVRTQPQFVRKLGYGAALARGAAVAVGAGVVALLARVALASAVDVVENAWFMPEAVDLREPLILVALFTGVFLAALRAAAGFARWMLLGATRERARAWLIPAGQLALVGVIALGGGSLLYDAGKADAAAAAGLADTEERARLVAVLSNDEGGPQTKVREVTVSAERAAALESYLSRGRSVHARAALGQLYTEYTLAMDAPALRRALVRGLEAGDGYARLLLLEHLQAAAPDEDSRRALEALSDESRLRVGPKAAARLALAWARHGEEARAKAWLARAAVGRGALPQGLVELPPQLGPLRPGRVSGRLRAPGRTVAALYLRRDPLQPSVLGPGQLVATALPGKDGRFRFEHLPPGVYYMAVGLEPKTSVAPERLRALGRRGDLTLSRARASIDVPLELRD